MCTASALRFFCQGGSRGEGHSQEEEEEDTTGLFCGGGRLEQVPVACQEGPRWAKDYRGSHCPPPNLPSLLSLSFWAGYRPGL